MGVPKFFRYISERYPCLSELVKDYQIPEFDNLYLDMNGVVHICSHPNDEDAHFRITEEKIFQDIFHYTEVLFRMIKPKKLFFIAIDGVAPRAKMNQQRGRRFRTAKEALKLETEALAKGEKLPTEARFDSNCITPGTIFMARLHDQLKYFIVNKISTDKLWQGCKIILSGHETPGEGEHKIMDYIRYMRSQPGYDPNTRHCLYGLDADLLMLGLCTHDPHFCLLREEVKFGKKETKRKSVPEEISFYLFHLSLLREYLDLEFASVKDCLPFGYDIEKIIDDWVLMGFLVGNDFIPHLPNMHIANGSLPILYNAYMKVLPTLGGYINESGTLNLPRFEKYLESLGSLDIDNFTEHYADLKYFEAKTGRRPNEKERTSYKFKQLEVWDGGEKGPDIELRPTKTMEPDLVNLIKATDDLLLEDKVEASTCVKPPEANLEDKVEASACMKSPEANLEGKIEASTCVEPSEANLECLATEEELEIEFDDESDETSDDDLFNEEFRLHKQDYYMNKLEYSQVTPEVLKSQAEGYVRAIQWNLNYYYNGVCSWSWYYPHHYAPYLSDIKGFADLKIEFELGTPFKPYEQLLAVLPSASKSLLPTCYQELMTSENSPLKHYYPTEFKTDLNGKRQDWEALVLIPFIEEDVLLSAMEPYNKKLTLEEIKRNTHRPMLIYEYSDENLGTYPAPAYFPAVQSNYAACKAVSIDDIRVPADKLVKGKYPGSKNNVFYPGFPTFRHLTYKASLEKAKVKVFEQPSRSENMIITVIPSPLKSEEEIAKEILGKVVFVGWPHLLEALVVAISNKHSKYTYAEGISEDTRANHYFAVQGIVNHYKNRLGVIVGEIGIAVHVKVMIGRKYICTSEGQVTYEKQWSNELSSYPYQIVVSDIESYDGSVSKFTDIQSVFPINCECYLLAQPHYGSLGKVIDSKDTLTKGRLKLHVKAYQEPNLSEIIEMEMRSASEYMHLNCAASRLAMSKHIFSRVTGTIFLISKNDLSSESSYKMNVGLNLKFSVKNKEVPGYTKRIDSTWLYSQKTVDLVESYCLFCPELFRYLNSSNRRDEIYKEDLFPQNCEERIKALKVWLKEQPHNSLEHHTCGSQIMEPDVVKKLEYIIDCYNNKPKQHKQLTMQVKPFLLYKPGIQTGNLMPDPSATFQLCDRIVNVRESYTVPLGLKGTVIAIHKSPTDADGDVVYDVLFDQPFVGGMTLNCSPNRGYRLPPSALINLSHGLRQYEKKTGAPGKLLETLQAANSQNRSIKQYGYQENSAFASFLSTSKIVPLNFTGNNSPHVNKYQPPLVQNYQHNAYAHFGGAYQQKIPHNKNFVQDFTGTPRSGNPNLANNIKNHNNFMPSFGRATKTKEQPQMRNETKEMSLENQQLKGKEGGSITAPPFKVDTETLKKVLKIDGNESNKNQESRQYQPSSSTAPKSVHLQNNQLRRPHNLSEIPMRDIPAPPSNWFVNQNKGAQKKEYVNQRRDPPRRYYEKSAGSSSDAVRENSNKNVFVPLQAVRSHINKSHGTVSSDVKSTKQNNGGGKNLQQRVVEEKKVTQPVGVEENVKSNNVNKITVHDSNNKKKTRKVRTAANFSVKLSLP